MITRRKVRRTLQKLGKTPEEVAKTLEQLKITGSPRRAEHCPIANYLEAELHRPASVGKATASVLGNNFTITLTIPRAISEFVRDFDQGKYPQLYGPYNNY